VTISDTFTSETKFRFRHDAGASDDTYFDDIEVVLTYLEECDDGNIDNYDGCTDVCEIELCGDNVIDYDVSCDI
jgi:cysteine-rich repeat protein